LILAYHGYLYQKVRRHPLQTAIGITNHARQTGALKNLVFRSYSRCRKKIYYSHNHISTSRSSLCRRINF
jgi:hypothetical protein